MIEIRLITKPSALNDAQSAQLVELHNDFLANQRELLKDVRPGPKVEITTELLLNNNVIAVAMESGNIVGYLLYRNLTGALGVRCIYVNPLFRQKGVMTAMLDAIHANETYHCISANIPPHCDHISNYFEVAGYPKVRDLNSGWTCYKRVYADSTRRPTTDRPAKSQVVGMCELS